MKVFTTTTTTTSLYDRNTTILLLIDRITKKLYFKILVFSHAELPELPMKRMEVGSKLSESILFTLLNAILWIRAKKPGPPGRSSSINPGPGAAVECKTPGVARGDVGAWN